MAKMEEVMQTNLSEASNFLHRRRIGLYCMYNHPVRCVTLNLQTIFDELVSLYIPLFQYQWQRLKWLVEVYSFPSGIPPWTYAARTYISAWIHDLYVSNSEAVRTYCDSTSLEHYSHDEHRFSSEYDEFLVCLNAAIRPTHIKGAIGDTIYIPILCECPAWDTSNPFHIENYSVNSRMVFAVIRNVKGWRISPILSNKVGRPSWLFDWHGEKQCCAWFPERNYTMDDVTIAYIVGAACTPHLGPRDVDDWQTGTVPENASPLNYERVVGRGFYGAYEARTIEQREMVQNIVVEAFQGHSPPKRKETSTSSMIGTSNAAADGGNEPSEEAIATNYKQHDLKIKQFRIIDWTYYCRVIWKMDSHTRSHALSYIVENSDWSSYT